MTKSITVWSVALYALLGAAQPALSHNDGAYNHDYAAVAHYPNWMAQVDGNLRVSELNLPGTHDTMSIRAGDIWQNQTMTLRQQLDSGIRVFDMRTRHINNLFRMHHGVIAQDTYFDDVLRDINAFLAANPSEAVLFRLRSEHTPENNTRSYAQTLDSYLDTQGARRWVPTSGNPTLNEIRGKFVILQEFSGGNYGIPYGSLDIQDDFSFTTNWDLYDKWTSVKNHMEKAENGDRNRIYMNYLSGAGGSFPYFVVSGHSSPGTSAPRLATGLTTPGWKNSYPDFPRVSCFIGICTIAFEGTNTLTADYIARRDANFVGMIMTDYPGKRLIENIISLNPSEYRELKDARSGKCLDFPGTSPHNGVKAILWDCANVAWQKWKYEPTTGLLRNQANPAYCLDHMGSFSNGVRPHMWQCYDWSTNQKWDWVGNTLRPRGGHHVTLDAYGTSNDSAVGLWAPHGGSNQQWTWGR